MSAIINRLAAIGLSIAVFAAGISVAGEFTGEMVRARYRFELSGQAQGGGTVTVGRLGTEKVLTFATAQGDGPAQLASKLVQAHQAATMMNSPFPLVSLTADGQAVDIENHSPSETYTRITDAGLQKVGAVTNLKAAASKAQGKVTLTWTAPNPQPDEIVIWRDFVSVETLAGTATSFEDTNLVKMARKPTYYIVCIKKNAQGFEVRSSDIAHVNCNKPPEMEGDTFRITSDQEFVPGGVKGKAYRFEVDKEAGTNPVTWSIQSGALPPGLSLTPADTFDGGVNTASGGTISGTPTATGTFNFTVKVTDANGATATKALSIKVTEFPVLDVND